MALADYPKLRFFYGFFVFSILAALLLQNDMHHPDEYAQVLRMSSYKLGHSEVLAANEAHTSKPMYWEFYAQMRPWLQPAIYYMLQKAVIPVIGYKPMIIERLLYLFGFFTFAIALILIFKMCIKNIKNKQSRLGLLQFTTITFVPFFIMRHSSEAVAAICSIYVLYFLQQNEEFQSQKKQLVLSGFLSALCFWFRFQMAFFFIGYWFLYLLFDLRNQWLYSFKKLLIFGSGVSIGLALGVLIDWWGYGEFVITPLNYYQQNIVNDKAANFGVEPWYFYLVSTFTDYKNPIILATVLYSAYRMRKNRFALSVFSGIAVFFVTHSMVGHKETRFMRPMLGAIAILFLLTYQTFEKPKNVFEKFMRYKVLAYACALIGFFFLAYKTLDGLYRGERKYHYYLLEQTPKNAMIITSDVNFVRSKKTHYKAKVVKQQFGATPDDSLVTPFRNWVFAQPYHFTELCQQNPKAFVLLTRKAYKLETDERLVDHVKLKHEWAKYPFGPFFDLARDKYLKDGGSWYRRLNRFKVLKCDGFLKDAKNIDLSKYRSYHEFQN